jgi:hypothetical protein
MRVNVRLKKTWPSNFRRTVRVDGKAVAILEWAPGDVIPVIDEHELAAIKDDIGKALEEMPEPVSVTATDESTQEIKPAKGARK